ncbi:unnamed protein product [Peronospora farinosa]|uniref:Uncharacterized protein n=1 Tax=Peronospora farinosa TaxID=134698 RepID=A0AAV0UR72_9STRA|nr:unnamed protein product [Peronospora farinosa]CAI5739379.1 unnamed protein product [Peronospora farinosa]
MELRRRCRRNVRVAEFVLVDACNKTIRTDGNGAIPSNTKKLTLFAGLVEVLYARNAWLAVRVDIWTSRNICYRQVKFSTVYLHKGFNDNDQVNQDLLEMIPTNAWKTLQQVEKLEFTMSDRGNLPALTADELTEVLTDVVQKIVETFKAVQVQILQTSTSQRAKFEYELLQHLPELEVLVVKRQRTGDSYVLFALPLLDENFQWDPKALLEKGELDSVYIPDGFNAPNFSDTTDRPMVFIGYSMMDEKKSSLDNTWPLVVEWPVELQLSSQVTQTPMSSEAISFVELIASCRKKFIEQWRRRKNFIAELRRRVIVLEYDALDFSQVFFMLQEQLDVQAPLRIMVLRLEFTTAYFFTNCMSDLRVSLLSGDDGVSPVIVSLDASSISHNSDDGADSQACVIQFLEFTQNGLLQHFYGH